MMEGESLIPLKAGSESVAIFPANNEEGNLTTDVCRRQGWPISEVRIGSESKGQRLSKDPIQHLLKNPEHCDLMMDLLDGGL